MKIYNGLLDIIDHDLTNYFDDNNRLIIYGTKEDDPSRTIKLLQAEKTPELMQYMDQISGVVNYVSQTFSLFNEVEKVRPKKLLK